MARFVPSRRKVLIGGGILGLLVGVGAYNATHQPKRAAGTADKSGAFLHEWIHVGTDGVVTVRAGLSEMGQGVFTAVATLVAEELGCRMEDVRAETGPASTAFRNIAATAESLLPNRGLASQARGDFLSTVLTFNADAATLLAPIGSPFLADASNLQLTGGSTSLQDRYVSARQAGALARALLVAAAARRWGVGVEQCEARDGAVTRNGAESKLSYGELALAALKEPPPASVTLKPRSAWTLIGKAEVKRVDVPAKVDGSAIYGIDVRRPGMLFAAIANCPTFGGALKSFDDTQVKAMPGVERVVAVPGGIAVVANSTWRAKRALEKLPIVWDDGPAVALDSAAIAIVMADAIGGAKTRAAAADFDAAFSGSAKQVSAEYSLPYLAHATMEPMNCTAEVTAAGVEVWAPTQAQTFAVQRAAEAAGVAENAVRLHTTLLGGGFGRRLENDYVAQAVAVAKALGKPVQAIWSREEDMRHDFYRPAALLRLQGGLDAAGKPTSLRIAIATQSIYARYFPLILWLGADETQAHGVVSLPYAIAATRTEVATVDLPVPVGNWRAVGHSYSAFAKESFIDEMANATGADPLAFRLAMLADQPRLAALLKLAAEKSGWGAPLAKGEGRGVALHTAFGTAVAEVVEVAVGDKGALTVKRVVAAVDCGTVVNPDVVRAQVESAVIFGLSAALFGKITIKGGKVEQSNFPDYDVVRMAQAPAIEVHIAQNEAAPGGIGEPGLPPLAPALANAIFAATGRRIRSLPLIDQGLTA